MYVPDIPIQSAWKVQFRELVAFRRSGVSEGRSTNRLQTSIQPLIVTPSSLHSSQKHFHKAVSSVGIVPESPKGTTPHLQDYRITARSINLPQIRGEAGLKRLVYCGPAKLSPCLVAGRELESRSCGVASRCDLQMRRASLGATAVPRGQMFSALTSDERFWGCPLWDLG